MMGASRLIRDNMRQDTPEDVRKRIRRQELLALVTAELGERFPRITAENFAEANTWREERVQELFAAEGLIARAKGDR